MPRTVKCGLIQATHAGPTDAPIEEIKRANTEKHLEMIADAARQGVQILCMQEVFTTPYFCDPRGRFLAEAPRDRDHLVVADLDLDMIREVRNTWQFFRDRRPDTYDQLVAD